jgi:hypothetical protein
MCILLNNVGLGLEAFSKKVKIFNINSINVSCLQPDLNRCLVFLKRFYQRYSDKLSVSYVGPDVTDEWLAILRRIQEVRGSNLSPYNNYPDRCLGISSVPPGKCLASTATLN